jgi:hypothetical protein
VLVPVALVEALIACIGALAGGLTGMKSMVTLGAIVVTIGAGGAGLFVASRLVLYWCRMEADPLTLRRLLSLLYGMSCGTIVRRVMVPLVSAVVMMAMLTLPGLIVHLVVFVMGWHVNVDIGVYVILGFIEAAGVVLGSVAVEGVRERHQRRRMNELMNNPIASRNVLLEATSSSELDMWVRNDLVRVLPTEEHERSFARLLTCSSHEVPASVATAPLFEHGWDPSDRTVVRIVDAVVGRMRERAV